jgi:hypothetical protein
VAVDAWAALLPPSNGVTDVGGATGTTPTWMELRPVEVLGVGVAFFSSTSLRGGG